MFCNKCGNEIAEGVNFCTKCGNPIAATTPPNQSSQQPIPPTYTGFTPPAKPQPIQIDPNIPRYTVSKSDYVKHYSQPNVRTMERVKKPLAFICIAILLFNFFYSFFGMSVMNDVLVTKIRYCYENDATFKEIKKANKQLKESGELLEERIESLSKSEKERMYEKDMDSNDVPDAFKELDYDEYWKLFDIMIDFMKNPSFFNYLRTVEDDNISELMENLYGNEDSSEDFVNFIKGSAYFSIALFLVGFIISILGLFSKGKSLLISGSIFSIIYAIAFGGVLQSILAVLGLGTMLVLITLIDKHYKNFQLGIE